MTNNAKPSVRVQRIARFRAVCEFITASGYLTTAMDHYIAAWAENDPFRLNGTQWQIEFREFARTVGEGLILQIGKTP